MLGRNLCYTIMFDYPCCTMFLEASLLQSMLSVIQVSCPCAVKFAIQVSGIEFWFIHIYAVLRLQDCTGLRQGFVTCLKLDRNMYQNIDRNMFKTG
jgi:hypothetical protein